MVNWEFFDNQSPSSALAMIEDIQAGRDIHPTRGPIVAPTFKENERVLAGFLDGHENEGPSAGPATLLGREIAAKNGWTEPVADKAADQAPHEGHEGIHEGLEGIHEGLEGIHEGLE